LIFQAASTIGGITHASKLQTQYGLKDTFQDYFTQQIHSLTRRFQGTTQEKKEAINNLVHSFPVDTMSPVWRIKGVRFSLHICAAIPKQHCNNYVDLDPHRDMPIEILHVVLLGFVKYFWRDVIARLTGEQRATLVTRLSCINISGLGISPLMGQTLVQYAGSLTGRDFRAIAQVALFILYDLLPTECFQAWLALCQMIPLIWQPEIMDLRTYIVSILLFLSLTHLIPALG